MARQPMEKYYPHVQGGDLIRESDLVSGDEDGLGVVRTVRGTFDFAVQGGAVGNHDLLDEDGVAISIPANSIILDGMVDVQTTFSSPTADTATLAIQAEGANDIVDAVAIATGTPWDQGLQAIVPLGTAASAVKTTVARPLRVVIGVEAVTVGKMTVFLRYAVTDVDV